MCVLRNSVFSAIPGHAWKRADLYAIENNLCVAYTRSITVFRKFHTKSHRSSIGTSRWSGNAYRVFSPACRHDRREKMPLSIVVRVYTIMLLFRNDVYSGVEFKYVVYIYILIVNVRVPWLMANVKSAYIRTATKACTLRAADRTTLVFIGRPHPRDGDTRTNRRSSSIVRRPDETVYDLVYKTVINHLTVPGFFFF